MDGIADLSGPRCRAAKQRARALAGPLAKRPRALPHRCARRTSTSQGQTAARFGPGRGDLAVPVHSVLCVGLRRKQRTAAEPRSGCRSARILGRPHVRSRAGRGEGGRERLDSDSRRAPVWMVMRHGNKEGVVGDWRILTLGQLQLQLRQPGSDLQRDRRRLSVRHEGSCCREKQVPLREPRAPPAADCRCSCLLLCSARSGRESSSAEARGESRREQRDKSGLLLTGARHDARVPETVKTPEARAAGPCRGCGCSDDDDEGDEARAATNSAPLSAFCRWCHVTLNG